ncbi:MAG TPA: calcium-binding protein [Actinomycetota bacterium]|nr:calcium-binding protein [Actinomycetota bacterium]
MKTIRVLAAAAVLVAATATTGSAQLPKLIPECFGTWATITGTEGDDVLTGTSGDDVIAGLDGDDVILGLEGGDALCGGAGDDEIDGGAGRDGIAVGRGADVARGGTGLDILVEFASDQCSPCLPADPDSRDQSTDRLFGGPGLDWLAAEGGDDFLDGGPGSDFALHLGRFTSVTIDLTLGRAVSTAGGVDELTRIESAVGSVNADTIRGDHRGNYLFGGGLSHDFVSGEDGPDTLYTDFSGSTLVGGFDEAPDVLRVAMLEAASIDLAAGTSMSREVSHFHSPDLVAGFEAVVGSPYEDVIYGDEGANLLEGSYGDDEIGGRGGRDYLFGEEDRGPAIAWNGTTPGNDHLDGGGGRDHLDGGPLVDECLNGESYANCEKAGTTTRASRVRAAPRTLPWWWHRYDVDYVHDITALETLLATLR